MSNIKNKIHFISLILLSYLALINCLVELPLTYKKIKELSKKNISRDKKSYSEPSKYFRLGETTSYEDAPLTLNDQNYFLATVKIGSNEEKFNLILETGSNNLWVSQRRIRSSQITMSRSYNPSSSTTSQNTGENFQLNYGSFDSVSGNYYIDNFKFMNNQIFKMKFGVVSTVNLYNNNYGNADGVIGLGHYYEDEQMSFMHMLKLYDITDSKIFSIKLDNDVDIEDEDTTGKLYIGKHEDFLSKKSVTCPLINVNDESNIYWNFQLDGIGLKQSNKEIKSSKSVNVILETATNVLILPYDYLRDIRSDLKEMNCDIYGEGILPTYYEIRCSGEIDTLPDFQLNINGTILTIPAKYAFELSQVNYYSNIYFTRTEQTYIIGSPLLFAYHTLFDSDNEKLHFYPNFEEKDDGSEKETEKENEKESEKESEKENEKECEKESEKENEKENEKESEKESEKENEQENDRNKTNTNDTESGTDNNESQKSKGKEKDKTNWAVIIPCIIGGIILLIGLAILIYWCVKSKNAKKDGAENNAETTEPIVDNKEDN